MTLWSSCDLKHLTCLFMVSAGLGSNYLCPLPFVSDLSWVDSGGRCVGQGGTGQRQFFFMSPQGPFAGQLSTVSPSGCPKGGQMSQLVPGVPRPSVPRGLKVSCRGANDLAYAFPECNFCLSQWSMCSITAAIPGSRWLWAGLRHCCRAEM